MLCCKDCDTYLMWNICIFTNNFLCLQYFGVGINYNSSGVNINLLFCLLGIQLSGIFNGLTWTCTCQITIYNCLPEMCNLLNQWNKVINNKLPTNTSDIKLIIWRIRGNTVGIYDIKYHQQKILDDNYRIQFLFFTP